MNHSTPTKQTEWTCADCGVQVNSGFKGAHTAVCNLGLSSILQKEPNMYGLEIDNTG